MSAFIATHRLQAITIVIKKLFAASLALISLSVNTSLIDFTASGDGNTAKDWNKGLKHAYFTVDPAANFSKLVFSAGLTGESIIGLSFDLRAGSDNDAFLPITSSIFLLLIGLPALRRPRNLAPEKNAINVLA